MSDTYALPDPPASDEIPEGWDLGLEEAELEGRIKDLEEKANPLTKAGIPPEVVTAFLVFQTDDGSWAAALDPSLGQYLQVRRQPNHVDLWHGGKTIADDAFMGLLLSNTTQNVVGNILNQLDARAEAAMKQMQQQQRQAQDQAANAAILQDLKKRGGLKGL